MRLWLDVEKGRDTTNYVYYHTQSPLWLDVEKGRDTTAPAKATATASCGLM